MPNKIKICRICKKYTLKETCELCKNKTESPHYKFLKIPNQKGSQEENF